MQYGLDEDIAKVIPLLDLQMDFLSIYDWIYLHSYSTPFSGSDL